MYSLLISLTNPRLSFLHHCDLKFSVKTIFSHLYILKMQITKEGMVANLFLVQMTGQRENFYIPFIAMP